MTGDRLYTGVFLPFWLAVIVALTLATTPALAESYRCKQHLVRPGDHAQDVLRKCGEPAQRVTQDTGKAKRAQRPRGRIEVWTYDPGPGKFLRALVFEDNRLKRIDLGERHP